MMRGHDHGGAIGSHGLYVALQQAARWTVDTGKCLIQQKKVGVTHPCASE
jgi:hypothetical protein